MDLCETIEHRGYTINVYYDPDSSGLDPTDWDGRASFALAHRRYDLRDDFGLDTTPYDGWDEVQAAIEEFERPVLILPVYMLDHSGVAMNVGGFSCGWDSGQIGFVYVTVADLNRWGWGGSEDDLRADLASQVETYGQWINGEAYGYTLLDPEGDEVDWCWGFVGEAGRRAVEAEAKSFVDHALDDEDVA